MQDCNIFFSQICNRFLRTYFCVVPLLKKKWFALKMHERGCNGYVLDSSFVLRLCFETLTPTEYRSSSSKFQWAFKRKLQGLKTFSIVW